MADPGFVHLHVHSAYSLLEGALPIARLAELAVADRQPALALTDTGNLFGALEFSEKLAKAGIQPIVGCALAVDVRRRARGPQWRARAAPAAHRAARRQRGRLPQSHGTGVEELPRGRARHGAACDIRLAGGTCRKADRAHRRAGRPDRPHARRRTGRSSRGRGSASSRRSSIDRLYVELQRHGSRASGPSSRQLLDLAYRARTSARGDQRALFRDARGLRGA